MEGECLYSLLLVGELEASLIMEIDTLQALAVQVDLARCTPIPPKMFYVIVGLANSGAKCRVDVLC